MKAVLTYDYFSHKDWIYERKLDGVRCIAVKNKDKVKLYSRNKKLMNKSYPELIPLLKHQKIDNFTADGEIVAFKNNITSFSRLQHRMQVKDPEKAKATGVNVFLYLFDILILNHKNIRKETLQKRKSILKNSFNFKNSNLRYLPHRNKEGINYYNEACQKQWEGIIAKKKNSKYLSSRSKKWLKFKCVKEKEFVIAGYTDPKGERIGFGSILIGYFTNKGLKYAGKVGAGFDENKLKELSKKFKKIEQEENPFFEKPQIKNSHWLKPQLVCQIKFSEWTKDKKLRHPVFLGLRFDKPAKKVVNEPTV